MPRSRWLLIVPALMIATPAAAEGVKVDPGKWEVRTSVTTPMSRTPQVQTSTECLRDEEVSVEHFMQDSEACSVTVTDSSATKLRWKLSCTTAAGRMDGDAEFSSTGSTIAGSMTMSMKLGEQEMKIESRWTGKRVGACE